MHEIAFSLKWVKVIFTGSESLWQNTAELMSCNSSASHKCCTLCIETLTLNWQCNNENHTGILRDTNIDGMLRYKDGFVVNVPADVFGRTPHLLLCM